jgi:hypothetical protein
MALMDACKAFPEQAKVLQERLVARRNGEMKDSSWLQLWWNQVGRMVVEKREGRKHVSSRTHPQRSTLNHFVCITFYLFLSLFLFYSLDTCRFEIQWSSTCLIFSNLPMILPLILPDLTQSIFNEELTCCLPRRSFGNWCARDGYRRKRWESNKHRFVRHHTSTCLMPAGFLNEDKIVTVSTIQVGTLIVLWHVRDTFSRWSW